ncbi:MAG TPA: ferritin family protein [Gammaproteobacteria bacterium]|nr:ferritin family protein [Gammaproteobacteria bacterium]
MKTLAEFLAHAVTLEEEAAERYRELADVMRTQDNAPAADLFERLARASYLHAAEAAERARVEGGVAELKPREYEWPGSESPESATLGEGHGTMTPSRVLRMALVAERTAEAFYRRAAERTDSAEVREMALEFADAESGHMAEIERWIERYPKVDQHSDEDSDPVTPRG